MRLIFMGSPTFALPALEALNASQHEVIACYTQPPRPAGRGKKLTPTPVHHYAEQAGLPVHYPLSLKPEDTQEAFTAYQADCAIVVAYGLLLPPPILQAPGFGCLNVHPSALPRWRGAAPLQRSIMAGDTYTELCIMQMAEGLDTGDVWLRKAYTLDDSTTYNQLHDQLADDAASALLHVLELLAQGNHTPTAQTGEPTYAAKISKEEARIPEGISMHATLRHIHGLSPIPGAWIEYGGERMKILRAIAADNSDHPLAIVCTDGFVHPTYIQRAGKTPMPVEDALRGMM